MLINEVCRACGLTKKAVEYYAKQGLIRPQAGENGYRNFTPEDAALLREIAVLRRLGLGVADIREILSRPDRAGALADMKARVELQKLRSEAQCDCLNHLLEHGCDIEASAGYIERRLDESATILDRLRQAFPGGYGQFLALHFGRFLGERIDSDQKAAAYCAIVGFLDDLEGLEFPDELEEWLSRAFDGLQPGDLAAVDEGVHEAIGNYDAFLREHREAVDKYLEYRNSEAFRASPACRLKQCLEAVLKSAGYYDVFIENLKVLSGSYRAYCEKMREVNERFVAEFPQAWMRTD